MLFGVSKKNINKLFAIHTIKQDKKKDSTTKYKKKTFFSQMDVNITKNIKYQFKDQREIEVLKQIFFS